MQVVAVQSIVTSALKLLFTKINCSRVRLMRFYSEDYSALTGALARAMVTE
jgi:hypothetical protein